MALWGAHGKVRSIWAPLYLSIAKCARGRVCALAHDSYLLLLLHPSCWDAHTWQPMGTLLWVSIRLCGLCAWFGPILSVLFCSIPVKIREKVSSHDWYFILFPPLLKPTESKQYPASFITDLAFSVTTYWKGTLTPFLVSLHAFPWLWLHPCELTSIDGMVCSLPSLACWDLEIIDSSDAYFRSWTCLSQIVVYCFIGYLFS